MPELPEVQTIVNDLQKIVGDSITGFLSNFPKAIKKTSPEKLSHFICGKKIISIKRIGKNILIELSEKIFLLVHLKMTGKLIIKKHVTSDKQQKLKEKHIHHIFYLENRSQKPKALEFHDIRKFGTITFLDRKNINLKLGIDPFDNSFTFSNFIWTISKKPKRKIKEILMDQAVISGIGNIYASEILFESRIFPNRISGSLSKQEAKKIFEATKKILKKAIRMRGTSVSDYRDASGKTGKFQNYLNVYGRHGQKCKRCGTIIEKSIISQRSTFYCPRCQR